LKVEAANVAASYEAVGTTHEVMCEQATIEFGIDKVINRETSGLVDPTIGIVGVKFDEEPLTGNEWLHMMQRKEHIDMWLFGKRNPLVIGNQVEDNMFAAAEVGKREENENYEAVTEQKKAENEEVENESLTKEHNKYVSNMFLGCTTNTINSQFIVLVFLCIEITQ